jgi:hypothetical protein
VAEAARDCVLMTRARALAVASIGPAWWINPTTGIWPELAEALRLDVVDIDATDETRRRVQAHWSVRVTITDIRLLHAQAPGSKIPDESFPELWNRTADPFAPLARLRGGTWEPISVEVTRGR